MNAIELITRSVSTGETTETPWTSALEEELEDLCECQDGHDEFCGETVAGEPWCVRLTTDHLDFGDDDEGPHYAGCGCGCPDGGAA